MPRRAPPRPTPPTVVAACPGVDEPVEPFQLVVAQLAACGSREQAQLPPWQRACSLSACAQLLLVLSARAWAQSTEDSESQRS